LSNLREERQIKSFLKSYDPFIVHYCFNEPIQTGKDYYANQILHLTAKAPAVNEVVFVEGVLNHWDEEANVRTNSAITLGQIRGRDDWIVDFIHPDEDSEYVKILYIAVSQEHQGSFRRCKEAVKAAYDLHLSTMTSSNKRWRQVWASHIRSTAEHGHRFVACAGGINHYSRMPIELMASTNDLISSLERYSKNYEAWIKSGAVKNPEKFLPKKP